MSNQIRTGALRVLHARRRDSCALRGETRAELARRAEYDAMLRLKEYLDSGPDSRKEVTAGITLEALQARYEAAMARERLETDRMKGIVPPRLYDRDDDQVAADELLGADR